jgi:hypothetical protein
MNEPITVFVRLLGEGTDVWRPVKASSLSDSRYVIQGPAPGDEHWQFLPGTPVACEQHTFKDGTQGLVAIRELSA